MAPQKWGYLPPGVGRSCTVPPAPPWSNRVLLKRVAKHGRPQPNTTPLSCAKLPGGLGGPTQVALPPPLPLPLPAVACRLSSSPRSRGSTSEWGTDHLWDIRARRLSRRQVSMWPPRSTLFSLRPVAEASGRPSVGPWRFRPPSSGRSVVGGGAACSPQVTWSVTSGGRCGGNPEPISWYELESRHLFPWVWLLWF